METIHRIIVVCIALSCGVVTGVLIGWFSGPERVPDVYENARREADSGISSKLINEMKAENVREFLWELTQNPHVAGTEQNKELADQIHRNWTEYGFLSTMYPYKVLLSFPSKEEGEENKVEILNPDGTANFTSQLKEKTLDDLSKEKEDLILPPFNAYSAQGVITNDLVYVNYARLEDFQVLEENGINLTGKIAIARYGAIFRGDKATFAAQSGVAGLILYSDPKDYAIPGGQTYPDGYFLPGTGAQRGTCMAGNGDPETPGYPSVEGAYRINVSNTDVLPSIPIHPIGYDDASQLLRRMGGEDVENDWAGSLPLENGYRYGPGFDEQYSDMSVRMSIFTKNEQAYAWNVIGVVRGSVEPDRYVLVGNHRDAWAFGAIDPSSGTASMLELSRAVGVLINKGWQPRRSIMFCSWGAEEQGLIGSQEWVEEFTKTLGVRVVAYINVDSSLDGTWVPDIAATPNLGRLIREATKMIPDPDPDEDRKTLYDTWKARGSFNDVGEPIIYTLGSGSDHASLLQIIGISALDVRYTYDNVAVPVRSYPMYHSVYETFDLVANYYDPSFKFMLAIGQLMGEIMRQLADSVIIPMDVADYARAVDMFFIELRGGDIGTRMVQEGLSFEYMESAVNNLTTEANAFKERLTDVDKDDILAVRAVNDQIMYLDRMFIDPMGVTKDRIDEKHVIFAPSSKNAYAGEKFAGIVDAMFDIDNNADPNKWEYVKMELAQVTYFVQSAAYMLQPVA